MLLFLITFAAVVSVSFFIFFQKSESVRIDHTMSTSNTFILIREIGEFLVTDGFQHIPKRLGNTKVADPT